MKTAASLVSIRARIQRFLPALLATTLIFSTAGLAQVAPKVKTKRPPFAEEVVPPEEMMQLRATDPLPGLPFDTSFDSEGWIDQGPGPTTNGDLNIAPGHHTAGCVTCVVPHPTNQNVLYIGTANGGVWKTSNALAASPRWFPLTDNELSMSIGGLARDLNDATGNTLVAGYGLRSSFGSAGGAHLGLIRTTDGGETWTRIGATPLAGRSIYQIEVRGNTFLLAVPNTDNSTPTGLYRTTDGGVNFTNMAGAGTGLPAGAVTHLAGDPSSAVRFYAHVAGTGVYRSTDAGASWTNISAGMAAANAGQVALAVAPTGTLFAAELAATSRVYRSTNTGANWTQMDNVQANTSSIFNGFVADPTNSNIVYLSGLFTRGGFPFSGRVVRGNASLAAGSQWVSIASTQNLGLGTAPHTDSRVMVFNAGNRLIEGDDGGIYELNIANVGSEGDGAGGGGTWRSLNGNLHVSEMHSMAYDRVARIVLGGAQDTGFQEQLKSGDGLWDKTSNGDGGDPAVDLLATAGQAIRYGSSQFLGGFYRRTNNASNTQTALAFPNTTLVGGGAPIVRAGPPTGNMQFVTPIATNPVAGSRLIIGGNATVYESTDQGNTVAQIDTNGANQIAKIAYGGRLAGANVPGVLFYGSGANVRFRTAASGAVTGNVACPGGTVQGIVFDPENWQTAYILGNNTVFVANNLPANGAGAFTNITGNLTGVGQMNTIEYLTLPSGGNAIVVGTDIGAYIMRVAAPGVWRTLGNNLPHAPVYDSYFDAAGQVLTVTCFGRGAWLFDFKPNKAEGQYGESFQSYTENTTTFPSRVGELFSNQLGTTTRMVDNDFHELQLLADGVGGTLTAFRLPDLNPGKPVSAFSAKWNATIYGDAAFNALADGFSFNFGPLGGITATAFTNLTYANEDGFNAGLTVSVRTYDGNFPGYYVSVNGVAVPGGFVSKPSANWGSFNTARHFFEVDWRGDTGLTLRVDGVAIFTNLATPGFIPAAGDRFVFGARTGGSDQETRLDNLAIFTGGVLTPVTGVAPFHFSSDFPQNGQTADKAFDGNVATKWLALDYTASIGASFPSAKTVRAYTLTTAEDVPERDPLAWDFQTSSDGTVWTQHGVQSEQYFRNRNERRAFVVAGPAAKTRFRLLIGENHEAPEIQLSEFQPWEFTTVPPAIIVTNTDNAGPGSLRAALAASATFDTASTITFAPTLSGQTITLASDLLANTAAGVTIDASALAAGLTIDGGAGTNRIFSNDAGRTLTLIGLTLTGGNGTGNFAGDAGGAVFNNGTVTLDRCAVVGNSSTVVGGALHNNGTMTVRRSTLSNSSSAFGGGIANYGALTVQHTTISGNSASGNGGGIDNGNGVTITLTLDNSIVAGNTASTGADINNFNGTVTRVGASIVQGYAGAAAAGSGTISAANPLLAPLDNYGGTTRTRALILNSPARNTSVGSMASGDQRGFPIVGGIPDIGAYEAGTLANYNAFIWETLPAGATVGQHAPLFDYDGDGAINGNEWLALTNPANPASLFRITNLVRVGANVDLTFTTVVGRNYTFEFSLNLVTWTPITATVAGTGNPFTITLGPTTGLDQVFYRVRVGP